MRWHGRTVGAVVGAAVVAMSSACSFGSGSKAELTVYSAQHENLVRAMVPGFTKETGIELEFRDGNDSELANQIVAGGRRLAGRRLPHREQPGHRRRRQAGPARAAGRGDPRPGAASVPPGVGHWVGFAARSTVLAYNPGACSRATSCRRRSWTWPTRAWKGRVGIAAGGADFQAIVSAVLALEGEDATATWLNGLKSNAEVYRSNTAVMKAVDEGEVDVGVMYHYYWYQDQAESGADRRRRRAALLRQPGPGRLRQRLRRRRARRPPTTPKDAQQLVEYLTGREAQERAGRQQRPRVRRRHRGRLRRRAPPLAGLDAPDVDPGSLDGPAGHRADAGSRAALSRRRRWRC